VEVIEGEHALRDYSDESGIEEVLVLSDGGEQVCDEQIHQRRVEQGPDLPQRHRLVAALCQSVDQPQEAEPSEHQDRFQQAATDELPIGPSERAEEPRRGRGDEHELERVEREPIGDEENRFSTRQVLRERIPRGGDRVAHHREQDRCEEAVHGPEYRHGAHAIEKHGGE
jgi:hypothetical protein